MIGRGWLTREDRQAWEQLRSDLARRTCRERRVHGRGRRALADTDTGIAAGVAIFALPSGLRAAGADAALFRADGDAWTVSDVPLLDELVDLLGPDKPADDSAERERKAEAEYAAGVLDLMVSREDLMADEDHLLATDLLYAEDLAERFVVRDTRELAERAAADRDWTYRHVVVDEAQELSEMDWRVLMRRCPSRSFTVVGDLAQRRSVAGATSWDTMLEPYVPGRWVYRSLSVNYRTPAEIMSVAAALLAEFAPGVQPPESVRATGVQPWSRRVTRDELPSAIDEFVRDEAGREGTSVVIGPTGCAGCGAAVGNQGPGVRRGAGGRAGPHPRRRARVAQPSCTSPSPAQPNALVSCTRPSARGAERFGCPVTLRLGTASASAQEEDWAASSLSSVSLRSRALVGRVPAHRGHEFLRPPPRCAPPVRLERYDIGGCGRRDHLDHHLAKYGVVLGCLLRSCPANLSQTVSATRELAKKCPAVQFVNLQSRRAYSYFQAKTGCSRSSTGSLRPSSPSHRSCNNTAPVGAWMRSFPKGICTTGRGLSGIVMKRGESLALQFVQPDPVDRDHLVGRGTRIEPSAAPDHHRGDHVSRPCRVVVKQPEHIGIGQPDADFFVQFPQRGVDDRFAGSRRPPGSAHCAA